MLCVSSSWSVYSLVSHLLCMVCVLLHALLPSHRLLLADGASSFPQGDKEVGEVEEVSPGVHNVDTSSSSPDVDAAF